MPYTAMDDERAVRDMIRRFIQFGDGGVSSVEAAILTAIKRGDKEVRRRLKRGFPVLVAMWEDICG